MHIAGQRIIRRLRISNFGAILRADMSWHNLRSSAPSGTPTSDHGGTGNLVYRLENNCSIAGDLITRDLADGPRAVITTISGALGQMVDNAKAIHTFNSVPIEIKTFGQREKRAKRDLLRAERDSIKPSYYYGEKELEDKALKRVVTRPKLKQKGLRGLPVFEPTSVPISSSIRANITEVTDDILTKQDRTIRNFQDHFTKGVVGYITKPGKGESQDRCKGSDSCKC
ncbi:hypothetical protein BY996DRAFT_6482602 [Phakopsora pachyrhizi]|nr:hypothetical protein BY996DRAFT_6482602 [Phakopsora pachyrhizi]